jgi:allophanate hydrolase
LPKPGLVRGEDGAAIETEIWRLPLRHFGSFVGLVPPPLVIGTVELGSGSTVKGFLCEPWALAEATDITDLGSWRAYLVS